MSYIHMMIDALRKCAKEHENENVCTGQIVTSALCKDAADFLEKYNCLHYTEDGEFPDDNGLVLVKVAPKSYTTGYFKNGEWFILDSGKFTKVDKKNIVSWMYVFTLRYN